MQTLQETSIKDIVRNFSDSVISSDLNVLGSLLSEAGEFNIQDESGEVIEVGKTEYMAWITRRINIYQESKIAITATYDQCLHCVIGDPVVLFNDGTFPRIPKDDGEVEKAGFRLTIKEGLITELQFCYTFLKTENKYMVDIKTARIRELMEKENMDFTKAFEIVKADYKDKFK